MIAWSNKALYQPFALILGDGESGSIRTNDQYT